ncbi:MAG: hypothetical protein Q4D58_10180 [Synergistaceae bacterium]|nr:hypothetical protein [Synergistaceae bacterium]
MKLTKPHEINMGIVKSSVMDLTEEELKDVAEIASDALITAIKP